MLETRSAQGYDMDTTKEWTTQHTFPLSRLSSSCSKSSVCCRQERSRSTSMDCESARLAACCKIVLKSSRVPSQKTLASTSPTRQWGENMEACSCSYVLSSLPNQVYLAEILSSEPAYSTLAGRAGMNLSLRELTSSSARKIRL